jgi:hypothetical protein
MHVPSPDQVIMLAPSPLARGRARIDSSARR